MKRRKFFLLSALALPIASLAKGIALFRTKKGLRVSDTESLMNGQIIPIGSDGQSSCKVSTKYTDGDLSFFSTTASHNIKGGPPLHMHFNQDEVFYVVQGEFIIQVGEDKFQMNEGDTLLAPRQIPHTFSKVGDKQGKLLTIFQPSGKMEDFINRLNAFKEMPKPDEFAKLFEEHDMKIVGPPLEIK